MVGKDEATTAASCGNDMKSGRFAEAACWRSRAPQTAHVQRLRDASKSLVEPAGVALHVQWRSGGEENEMDGIRRSNRAASGARKALEVLFLSSMW